MNAGRNWAFDRKQGSAKTPLNCGEALGTLCGLSLHGMGQHDPANALGAKERTMYAVIEDSGTQIRVETGDVIRIDVRDLAEDAKELTFDKVLLVSGDDAAARIGQPYLAGATVQAEILREGRGDKVEVVKFKRRKDYLRRRGHRQNFVEVRIGAINA